MLRDRLSPGVRLWQNRSFTLFWTGQTLSVFGDAFSMIAFPLLVLQATGSVGQMGLVTAVIGVCRTVTGLFAGWLVDHFDRRHLMICSDTLRALLYFTLPLLWWLMGPQLWLIYVVAALGSFLGMIFQVTFGAVVANLVDTDQIVLANSRLQTTFSLSTSIGPILAGIIAGLFYPGVAIAIDACSFAISAGSILLIHLRPLSNDVSKYQEYAETTRQRNLAGKRQSPHRFGQEFLAGLQFIWREPILRSMAILLFFINLMNAGVLDILIFHIRYDLGQNDGVVGGVLGCGCVGGVIAGLVGPHMRKYLGFGPCWIGCFGLYFVAIFLMGFSTNLLLLGFLAGLLTFTMTVTAICSISLRQQITPDFLLGRVTSAFLMMVTMLSPVGAVLFTTLTARFGVMVSASGMGIGGILLICITILTPIRQRHPERHAYSVERLSTNIPI